MRWRIRRIVNGCAAQQLVARQDVIAPEFISYGYPCNQQKGLSQAGLTKGFSRPQKAAAAEPWRWASWNLFLR
jgi:hypothetical protein